MSGCSFIQLRLTLALLLRAAAASCRYRCLCPTYLPDQHWPLHFGCHSDRLHRLLWFTAHPTMNSKGCLNRSYFISMFYFQLIYYFLILILSINPWCQLILSNRYFNLTDSYAFSQLYHSNYFLLCFSSSFSWSLMLLDASLELECFQPRARRSLALGTFVGSASGTCDLLCLMIFRFCLCHFSIDTRWSLLLLAFLSTFCFWSISWPPW